MDMSPVAAQLHPVVKKCRVAIGRRTAEDHILYQGDPSVYLKFAGFLYHSSTTYRKWWTLILNPSPIL